MSGVRKWHNQGPLTMSGDNRDWNRGWIKSKWMGPNFEKFFRSHDPIKMKVLKDCLLLSSKCRLICLQQTSFVNNQSPLIQIQNFRFFKKSYFFLTIIKGTTVILNFCHNFGFFLNRNRILVGIKMIMIPLRKFFLDEPNKKIKTCFSVINWIYQNDFFKITTWKISEKNFSEIFATF